MCCWTRRGGPSSAASDTPSEDVHPSARRGGPPGRRAGPCPAAAAATASRRPRPHHSGPSHCRRPGSPTPLPGGSMVGPPTGVDCSQRPPPDSPYCHHRWLNGGLARGTVSEGRRPGGGRPPPQAGRGGGRLLSSGCGRGTTGGPLGGRALARDPSKLRRRGSRVHQSMRGARRLVPPVVFSPARPAVTRSACPATWLCWVVGSVALSRSPRYCARHRRGVDLRRLADGCPAPGGPAGRSGQLGAGSANAPPAVGVRPAGGRAPGDAPRHDWRSWTMSRVRIRAITVLLWVGLASVTGLLHLLGTGVLGPPPLLHPDRILAWWQARGALLATFATAREVLCGIGAYLWIVWTAVGLASWASFPRLLDALSWCRLPGAKAAVRTIAGVSALGAALVAGATPTWAAGTGSTTAAGDTAAPVLRYEGPAGAPIRGAAGSVRPRAAAEPGAPATVRRYSAAAGARDATGRTDFAASCGRPRCRPISPPPTPGRSTSPPPAAARRRTDLAGARDATGRSARRLLRPPAPPLPFGPRPGQPQPPRGRCSRVTICGRSRRPPSSRAWGQVPPEQDLARYWWKVVQNKPAAAAEPRRSEPAVARGRSGHPHSTSDPRWPPALMTAGAGAPTPPRAPVRLRACLVGW